LKIGCEVGSDSSGLGAVLKSIYDAELYIGARLVAARQLRNLSQATLAEKLGVTTEQVQKYEQGLTQLTAGRLYDVARALGIDVSFFYEGLGEVSAPPASMTDERYAMVRQAVQRIAADYELTRTGHRKRLARHEAINVAREVCEALGWNYGFASAVRVAPALAAVDER
jgi:transcriptional regulator with XRE-family HTH domain